MSINRLQIDAAATVSRMYIVLTIPIFFSFPSMIDYTTMLANIHFSIQFAVKSISQFK